MKIICYSVWKTRRVDFYRLQTRFRCIARQPSFWLRSSQIRRFSFRPTVSAVQQGLQRLNLFCRGFDASLLEEMTKAGASGMTADAQAVPSANESGTERFVRPGVSKLGMTVDPGFMCKTQVADNGPIRGDQSVGSEGRQLADGEQMTRIGAAAKRWMHQQDHDYLLQRGIPGPFPETVYCDA